MKWIKGKSYSQWGTTLIVMLLPSFIFFLVLLVRLEQVNELFYIYLLISALLLFCLLCFYNLTITIENTHVAFKLGIGLIKRRYKISDIKSCKPVSYSFFSGFGIRVFPNGVLYNVSGLKAVELQFYDRKSVVRIGTNQPEEISQQIQSLIDGNKISSLLSSPNRRRELQELKLAMILLPIIVFIGAIGAIRDTMAEINDEELIIKGIHGVTIPLSEIERVDTVSSLSWRRRTGYYFPHTIKARVTRPDGSRMMVFLKVKHKPFIFIQLKNNKEPVCLNFRDRKKTIYLYNQLKNKSLMQ